MSRGVASQARLASWAVFVAALTYAAHVTVGFGGREHGDLWNTWFYEAIEGAATLLCLWRARAGRDRGAWGAIGVALLCFWLGDVYFDHVLPNVVNPPDPSWADAGYLAHYLPLYVGMMLLIRARAPRLLAASWLEGVVGALALASVAATFVFSPVVASTHGATAKVAINLAYPTFDVVLLAIVAAGFALQGRCAGRAWTLLGIGLLLSGAANALYLIQTAHGTYSTSGWVNAGWPLSAAFIAIAAWTPGSHASKSDDSAEGWAEHMLTGFFAVLIVGVLAMDAVWEIPLVAHVLLTLAIIALLARLGVAGRERRQLARTTVEARTDELTGLANRRSLYTAIERALAGGGALALLLLDLNRFKELNDTLGHNIGDEALCQIAARLTSALPPSRLLARLGGDEFVALLCKHDALAALRVAESLQEALEEPFPLDNFLIPIQVSVGIALAPGHASTRAELMRCADVAMYRAKSQQTGVEIYKLASDGNSRDRLLLIIELRHAIGSDQPVLHYQPKVSISNRCLAGVEALVRWRHPRLGMLFPGEFIPLAEREGLIRHLTLEVLDGALRQQLEWRQAGEEVPIAINLSPANLLDQRLPTDVAQALDRYQTPGHLLELEITESMLMRDSDRAMDIMARISELGVEFSLDDFGTGYSSLAQLKHLPVGTLKIDRSFVMNMVDDEADANIVRSIIQMGQSLNLRIVAEGVESASHLETLEEFGCDTAQGFYLGPPIQPTR